MCVILVYLCLILNNVVVVVPLSWWQHRKHYWYSYRY